MYWLDAYNIARWQMGMKSRKEVRILVLASEFPCPLDSGGKIRVDQMIRSVADIFTADLITFVRSKSSLNLLDEYKMDLPRFH